jgi:hypothetical protein
MGIFAIFVHFFGYSTPGRKEAQRALRKGWGF